MKTILIYDQLGEAPLRFSILEGNYAHLDRVYINTATDDPAREALMDELSSLIHDSNGREKLRFTEKFPTTFLSMHPDTKVIVAGFLP